MHFPDLFKLRNSYAFVLAANSDISESHQQQKWDFNIVSCDISHDILLNHQLYVAQLMKILPVDFVMLLERKAIFHVLKTFAAHIRFFLFRFYYTLN